MERFVDYVQIGVRMRQARKTKGWTQARLAEAVGCSTANITNIEKAKTKLSLNMLVRIIDVLGVSADEVIGPKSASSSEALPSIEAELQKICAGLSPGDAQTCRQACLDFCAAFSRHFAQE